MIRLTTPFIPFAKRADQPSECNDHQLQQYFDALATRLVGHQTHSNGESYAIGLTGCAAAVGVSTVARNLAMTFAQSRGQSTLLIDASNDGPDLGEVFGNRGRFASEPGGDGRVRDRIFRTEIDNLSVLSAGDTVLPVSTVDGQPLHQLVEELKKDFHLILVDMPRANQPNTGIALASAVDGVVLVVEPEAASVDDAYRAKGRLQRAGANLLGVVLNKDRLMVL